MIDLVHKEKEEKYDITRELARVKAQWESMRSGQMEKEIALLRQQIVEKDELIRNLREEDKKSMAPTVSNSVRWTVPSVE